MKLELLYKKTKKDQIQTWEIEIEGNKFRTNEGILNGTITTSEWTTCISQNIGRSNETTPEDQALKEAKAKWVKKVESGYVQDLKDIDNKRYFEPMLAHKWRDYRDKVNFPVFCQKKYDGIRCVISKNGMFTRNGKPIVAAHHIFKSIKDIFEKVPNLVLDGELYFHSKNDNFNKIVSLVKKVKLIEDDLIESEKLIQYHCYDCYLNNDLDFSERNMWLNENKIKNQYIILADTYLVNNKNELDKLFYKFLEDGYEGLMIRLDTPYENKRSKNLLKMKPDETDEFEILDIIEGLGNKSNMAGSLLCKLSDGRTFNSNLKGGFDLYKEIWINKNNYIGKTATIRYQNLTIDGIPRFPYCIAIDRESFE